MVPIAGSMQVKYRRDAREIISVRIEIIHERKLMDRKANRWETLTALVIVLFGAAMAYWGSTYPVGTVARMGPGYFPLLLGLLSMALGILTIFEVRSSDATAPEIPWRAFLFVFSGIVAWALTVERFGLLPSSVALIVICSFGRPPLRIWTTVLTAGIVSVGAVVIFIEGFDLPLQVVKW